MEKRRIGSLEVSAVGLGCNNFGGRLDATQTASVVHAALDAGITFLDTADVYVGGQSEEFIGRALGPRRSEVVIATKFGNPMQGQGQGAGRDYIQRAVEASLRRLGTDHIDLYQIHRPDPNTPIAETLGMLDELVRAGKVHEIGCSNFSVELLQAAEAARTDGGARFVSVQNEYSLLKRDGQDDVLVECERTGLAYLPYFPLGSGLLTGKYRLGQEAPAGSRLAGSPNAASRLNDRNLQIVEDLIAFAGSRGRTILELAVSWLLVRPVVASVIAGATKAEQVRANVGAAGWQLTADDLAEVDRIVGAQA